MDTSSSMRKFPSRNEFTVLPKDAGLPEEESESPTPEMHEEESESPTPVQNNVMDRDQPDKKSWSNPEVIGEVLKYCIQIGVIITVLIFQFRGWPQVPDVYNTDDPWNTSRGGETYTCECILPEDLTANTSLNFCHERGSLEDVTILTFSDFASAKIGDIVAGFESDASERSGSYTIVRGGYKVSQDAYGLHRNIDIWPDATASYLYIYAMQGSKKDVRIDNLLSPNFEFTSFSIQSYVRLYFQYYCNSCVHCGPDEVNNAWHEMSNIDWSASCFYRDIDEVQGNLPKQTCKQGDAFFVKCVAYPIVMLPPSDAIWAFLKKIVELQGSLNLSVSGERNEPKNMTLEPSHLYLNMGQFQSSEIRLIFMEVIKNSPMWVSLLTSFPSLGNECATMSRVRVCNGTSVCNLFTNRMTGSYDSRCLDMKNKTQCKQLMTPLANGTGDSALDNTQRSNLSSRLNGNSWLELECPEFICESVHPSFVRWEQPLDSSNDPLNQFLDQWILGDNLAQRGLCSTTHRDVYRYRYPRADDLDGSILSMETMLLETECKSTGWQNPDAKCWLTGRYHNIDDSPTDDWKHLGENNSLYVKRFTCSGQKKEGFGSWFIATMGILFGWIGTVELISKWFAKRIQPWIRKKEN